MNNVNYEEVSGKNKIYQNYILECCPSTSKEVPTSSGSISM